MRAVLTGALPQRSRSQPRPRTGVGQDPSSACLGTVDTDGAQGTPNREGRSAQRLQSALTTAMIAGYAAAAAARSQVAKVLGDGGGAAVIGDAEQL